MAQAGTHGGDASSTVHRYSTTRPSGAKGDGLRSGVPPGSGKPRRNSALKADAPEFTLTPATGLSPRAEPPSLTTTAAFAPPFVPGGQGGLAGTSMTGPPPQEQYFAHAPLHPTPVALGTAPRVFQRALRPNMPASSHQGSQPAQRGQAGGAAATAPSPKRQSDIEKKLKEVRLEMLQTRMVHQDLDAQLLAISNSGFDPAITVPGQDLLSRLAVLYKDMERLRQYERRLSERLVRQRLMTQAAEKLSLSRPASRKTTPRKAAPTEDAPSAALQAPPPLLDSESEGEGEMAEDAEKTQARKDSAAAARLATLLADVDEDGCCVCLLALEDASENGPAQTLECGHTFHEGVRAHKRACLPARRCLPSWRRSCLLPWRRLHLPGRSCLLSGRRRLLLLQQLRLLLIDAPDSRSATLMPSRPPLRCSAFSRGSTIIPGHVPCVASLP